MRKIMLLIIIMSLFIVNVAYANPIFNTVDGNWTKTILVYSNDKINVYIPESMLVFNVFYTKYRQNGNFGFVIYTEIKDENNRQMVINLLKDNIVNNKAFLTGQSNIESLRYMQISAYFDFQNYDIEKGHVNLENGMYLSEDGKVIATENHNEIIYLLKSPFWTDIASGCNNALEGFIKEHGL